MDQQEEVTEEPVPEAGAQRFGRRRALKLAAGGLAGLGCAGSLLWLLAGSDEIAAEIFRNDAPSPELWAAWQKRGWVQEASHYLKLGRNVQCRVCPNHCLLEPGDRSHCRNRVNRDGVLYTLAYSNPCTFHIDPVEKKPLFHFHPGSRTFSLATSGCVFRCFNCQNWEISQKKPEELKDASGPEYRLKPGVSPPSSLAEMARLTMTPEDVAAVARWAKCPSVSYTYSEPVSFYEYTRDTCRQVRQAGLLNIVVTCGFIKEEPLRQLAPWMDAAHVDLKGFDEETYRKLNGGRLAPVLNTLKTLKSLGVWFEVIHLMVPGHTDKIDVVRRMCDWLVKNVGPDCPIHFSRFHPAHKLAHLPPTPVDVLVQAREAALAAGLHYPYIGNVRGVEGAETTFCPKCKKPVVEREVFLVTGLHLEGGRCKYCQTQIAGVWGSPGKA